MPSLIATVSLGPPSYVGLLHDVRHVHTGGLGADEPLPADLCIRETLRDEGKNLGFKGSALGVSH